ncbi:MAG: GlsB/YeaQ/YmgE family stress response membrane protein [Chloroflexi bacterium]|nr:MAG: GlsB/YeaQ/YmgE family stress response membrane protein [Chloroflexota bacterium]TME17123.1 MAG: GlsB/YeaQ/YmgE family stress response membrane protein [Chloroflexota bacterium]TME17248.1 MAG: GlsB/YeaQ/YmgE family stress response membrane protein [Chloroflexota bacterium]
MSHGLFLNIVFEPRGILAWLLIGLLAGALAGRVVRGRGYGCLLDIVIGIAGSVIGGALLGYFVQGDAGFFETLVVSFLGAVVLLAFLRLVTRA